MVEPRAAISTVTFIDNYCAVCRDLFSDVRSFEAFKYLHLGMISDLPRKSYRVTHYSQIERWWEIVSSAYLMVSLQCLRFHHCSDGLPT